MGIGDWVGDRVEDAAGAYGDAMDWVLPGDGVVERGLSMVDGSSPLSPMVSPVGPALDVGEAAAEAVPEAADRVAEASVPGYGAVTDAAGVVDGVVGHVPGGYAGAGLGLLLLLVLLLAKPAGRAGRNVARGAARTYAPAAYAVAHGKPAPRAQGRHASAGPRPKGRHSGRPGAADVVTTTAKRLEVCADSERDAMKAARRRWQGWNVRPGRSWVCDVNPSKVHVHVSKEQRKP